MRCEPTNVGTLDLLFLASNTDQFGIHNGNLKTSVPCLNRAVKSSRQHEDEKLLRAHLWKLRVFNYKLKLASEYCFNQIKIPVWPHHLAMIKENNPQFIVCKWPPITADSYLSSITVSFNIQNNERGVKAQHQTSCFSQDTLFGIHSDTSWGEAEQLSTDFSQWKKKKKNTDVIMKILGHTNVSTSLYQRSRWLEKIKYFKKLLTFKVVLTTAPKTFDLCLCHISSK